MPSGFTDLDELTAGFQAGDLVIIAARPSVGKTALVLNIAQHVGTKTGRTVGIFSLEMSKEQLFLRMLTSEARIDSHRLRTGFLVESDWGRLSHALGTLSEAKVFIDDTPGIGVLEMRAKSRRLMAEHGLDLLIVDYIQLMQGRGRFENRTLELAAISRSLKMLAKELNVPVVILSQLSRAPEARSDHRPMLSDLRESGALEQDADVVMLLFRARSVSGCEARRREHCRGQHRQAAQRPDRPRAARIPEVRNALRQSRTHRGSERQHARCTFAHVDLGALQSNFRAIREFLRSELRPGRRSAGIIGVVKANAYGHGAPAVALALQEAGATILACADIEEAIVLRKAGVTAEILIFGALGVSDVDGVFEHSLTPTISTPGAGRSLQAAAARHGVTLSCHLKIDTGMNRLGLALRQPRAHAAGADGEPQSRDRRRCTRTSRPPTIPTTRCFRRSASASSRCSRDCRSSASTPRLRHAANSAATLRDSRVWYDLVRPGLMMYGVIPPPLASTIPLSR